MAFQFLWHSTDKMNGCDLANKVCHEYLLLKTKGDAVFSHLFHMRLVHH